MQVHRVQTVARIDPAHAYRVARRHFGALGVRPRPSVYDRGAQRTERRQVRRVVFDADHEDPVRGHGTRRVDDQCAAQLRLRAEPVAQSGRSARRRPVEVGARRRHAEPHVARGAGGHVDGVRRSGPIVKSVHDQRRAIDAVTDPRAHLRPDRHAQQRAGVAQPIGRLAERVHLVRRSGIRLRKPGTRRRDQFDREHAIAQLARGCTVVVGNDLDARARRIVRARFGVEQRTTCCENARDTQREPAWHVASVNQADRIREGSGARARLPGSEDLRAQPTRARGIVCGCQCRQARIIPMAEPASTH